MRTLSLGFAALSLVLAVIAVWILLIPVPAWTRSWSAPSRWTSIPSSGGPVVTAEDLAGLGRGIPRGAEGDPFIVRPAVEPLDLAALLSQMHASIRAEERIQWQASSRMMASYLEAWVAERLAVQEGIWKERLDGRRRELTEKDERILAAYAAKIRREALPDLSALQMEIALSPEKERGILEEELARAMAATEEEVARKREELEKERGRSLDELRREARESLDRLAADLRAEAQRALADYLIRGGEAFSTWLAEDLRAEAALVKTWGSGFGAENEKGRDDGGEDGG